MSDTFALQFNTDNAAFEGDNKPSEIARILRAVAFKVEAGETEGKARDINGNSVGAWLIQ